MKKTYKKLTLNKESMRVLSKPELTVAVGGDDSDACPPPTAFSICLRCGTGDNNF